MDSTLMIIAKRGKNYKTPGRNLRPGAARQPEGIVMKRMLSYFLALVMSALIS